MKIRNNTFKVYNLISKLVYAHELTETQADNLIAFLFFMSKNI